MKAYDYQITDPWFARPIPQTRVQRPVPEGDNDNSVIDDLIEDRLFESEEPEEDIQDY